MCQSDSRAASALGVALPRGAGSLLVCNCFFWISLPAPPGRALETRREFALGPCSAALAAKSSGRRHASSCDSAIQRHQGSARLTMAHPSHHTPSHHSSYIIFGNLFTPPPSVEYRTDDQICSLVHHPISVVARRRRHLAGNAKERQIVEIDLRVYVNFLLSCWRRN